MIIIKSYIWLIILLFLVIVIVLLLLFNRNGNNKYNSEILKLINNNIEHGELVEILYSNSGNSVGNIDKITINKDKIITEYSLGYGNDIKICEYSISLNDYNELLKIIDEYNLIAWSKLETNDEEFQLDGAEKYFNLVYDNSSIGGSDKELYYIYYNMKIPTDGYNVLNDLVNKMKSFVKDENLIKEYNEEYN